MARIPVIRPGEERQRKLFEALAHTCLDHSMTDIQGAAVNLLLTVVQRNFIKLADAETRWDELMGRGRLALQRRYQDKSADAEREIAGRLGM